MKINSGEYKYRNMEIPEGIRPTTEKVREAVFSMLTGKISGATVLDLFSGSGSLGLEALSRGAEKCYFNEGNRKNFSVLKQNVLHCRAEKKAVLLNNDFRKALSEIDESINIVFLDPPYKSGFYEDAMILLEENRLLTSDSLVIAEHLYNNPLDGNYGNLYKIKEKRYGTIAIDIFKQQ